MVYSQVDVEVEALVDIDTMLVTLVVELVDEAEDFVGIRVAVARKADSDASASATETF